MRVMYERVAGIDVHKDMIKVGIRTPGHRAWTRTSEVLEYRTFYGVLQARYHKLVRRFGGPKNPAAVKKAILAIAHTLLKIAYQVLRSGKPYEDLGADFYARRESPEQRRAYLLRQLEKLSPGCTITITPAEGA